MGSEQVGITWSASGYNCII